MKNKLTNQALPVAQWQVQRPGYEDGTWANTYEADAKWWRDNSPGSEARALVLQADAQALLDAAVKDTAAIIEIDRVMLESGAHWPDLETDALVVRHVKELTRMLNAALVTPATTPGAPEQTDNIISLVQRLALALRQADPAHPLPALAIDYLHCAGVRVNALREAVQPAIKGATQ